MIHDFHAVMCLSFDLCQEANSRQQTQISSWRLPILHDFCVIFSSAELWPPKKNPKTIKTPSKHETLHLVPGKPQQTVVFSSAEPNADLLVGASIQAAIKDQITALPEVT